MPADAWPRFEVEGLLARGVLDVGDGYRAKRSELDADGLPFARAGNINDGFHFDGAELLGWTGVRAAKQKVSRPGDVVFTSKGTVGRFALVRPKTPQFVYSPQLCFWRSLDSDALDPRFLFCWMNSREFLHQVAAVKGQTDMAEYVSLRDQRRMKVTVPPIDEQRRIAAVLGALDDKIELNRKMNRTLEEMAQALFKSWFIDFDGHDDLVDSEIGPVPRGWEVGGIDSVADNVRDTVDPTSLADDTPYVGLEHVPRRCVALDTWGRASDAGSTKTRFQRGDTLFGKLRPYFHKVVPAPVDGVSSTDILVIRTKEEDWRWFAFGHLYSDAMVAHTTAAADGTKMPRTNWKDLCRFPVAIPPKERAAEYGRSVVPMYERIATNVQESRTLTDLRDALLPKLISGELRVPEAEGLVEAAAGC